MQNRWVGITLALLLSSFFWLSIKLVRTYTTELEVPIVFKGLPRDLELTDELPTHLRVQATGVGHRLLWPVLFGVRSPLEIDLESALSKGYLPVQQFSSKVQSQLPRELTISRISPDTLFARFEAKESRRVHLVSRLQVIPERGYRLIAPPRLIPDSVLITGPYSQVSEVEFWKTTELKLEKLTRNKRLTVPVESSSKLLVQPSKCLVELYLEQYIELKKEVPVQIEHQAIDRTVRVLPKKVTVYYQIPMKEAKTNAKTEPRVVVDARTIDEKNQFALPVVLNLPPNAQAVRVEPPALHYVLRFLEPPVAGVAQIAF